MVSFNQLKALGTDLIGKAGEIADQAKEKAGPLAEQAKEKAGPLAEKAKDAAAKGVDKAADGLDSATGGKYKAKIDSVSDKLGHALHTPADTGKTGVTYQSDIADTTGVADPIHAAAPTDSATTVQADEVTRTDSSSPWPAPNDPDLPPATVLDS